MTLNQGDIIEIIMKYTLLGQFCQNSYGFLVNTGGLALSDLPSDLNTHVDANGQTFSQSFMYGKGAGASLTAIKLVDVYPGTRAPYELAVTVAGGEGSGTDQMPPQDAAVVTWRTDNAGRSYRGREYESGKLEGDQAGGTWTAGTLANSKRHLDWLMGRYGPSGTNTNYTLGVISRFHNNVRRPNPTITAVVSYTQRATVYTQRRRTLGHGR